MIRPDTRTLLPAIAIAFAVGLAGCSDGDDPDARIRATVDALVDALNDHDTVAARRLYAGEQLAAISAAGDSSVVYRLLTIPGGEDFAVDGIQTSVLGDRAQTQFALTGSVARTDEVVGEMTMRVGLDLERVGEEWRILPGSDRIVWSQTH